MPQTCLSPIFNPIVTNALPVKTMPWLCETAVPPPLRGSIAIPCLQSSPRTTDIPATCNTVFGFFGTMNDNAEAAWPLAMTAISDATYQPLESVRDFLDSRHGRHFADDVLNMMYAEQALEEAIHAATAQWMERKIGRAASRN